MDKYRFDFPKSLALVKDFLFIQSNKHSIVLDFFAGSGTTAHAVMKLNSEDGGRRKFILVEMADYFDTVVIPRIKKVAYSFEWKDGKPQNSDGNGVFFKYHTLEQYEDSLENIDFEEARTVNMKLDSQNKLLKESLLNLPFNELIRYKLSVQENKLLNIEKFEKPYSYKLKILDTKNTQKSDEKTVDLIETFVYLSGLETRRVFRKDEYTILVVQLKTQKLL
jgi:adenine-specific DNA-methyltransferase